MTTSPPTYSPRYDDGEPFVFPGTEHVDVASVVTPRGYQAPRLQLSRWAIATGFALILCLIPGGGVVPLALGLYTRRIVARTYTTGEGAAWAGIFAGGANIVLTALVLILFA